MRPVAFSCNRPKWSWTDLNKAIELGTDSGEIYHNRGLTHRVLGNSERVDAYLAKAKELGYKPEQ